jgi:hypothetical protein
VQPTAPALLNTNGERKTTLKSNKNSLFFFMARV